MNPQSALHITSGFLPQKQITLLREHWDVPVSKIAPTFKVGPVLVDPANIRMPIESANPVMNWEWLHREGHHRMYFLRKSNHPILLLECQMEQ